MFPMDSIIHPPNYSESCTAGLGIIYGTVISSNHYEEAQDMLAIHDVDGMSPIN